MRGLQSLSSWIWIIVDGFVILQLG